MRLGDALLRPGMGEGCLGVIRGRLKMKEFNEQGESL